MDVFLQAAVQVASADVAMYESEVAELGDIEELSQQRERIQAQIKANKGTINDYTVSFGFFLQTLINEDGRLI